MALHFEYNMGNECGSLNKSVQSKKSLGAARNSRKCWGRYESKFGKGLRVIRKCRAVIRLFNQLQWTYNNNIQIFQKYNNSIISL